MVDVVDAKRRSEIMSRIRSKGTKPEMTVRRLLHGMGYRYRVHVPELPGKPDLVFVRKHKVIEVRGCFWHQHKDAGCRISRRPKSNRDYWLPKLKRNVERDAEHEEELRALGWDLLVLWECEVVGGAEFLERVVGFLEGE